LGRKQQKSISKQTALIGLAVAVGLLVAVLSFSGGEESSDPVRMPAPQQPNRSAPAIPGTNAETRPKRLVTEQQLASTSPVTPADPGDLDSKSELKSEAHNPIPQSPEESKEQPEPRQLSATDSTGVELLSGFDCSPKNLDVKAVSAGHFEVRFPKGGRNAFGYFLFQLKNAKGKQVRIDLLNVPLRKWKSVNPLVLNDTDLGLLENFESFPPSDPKPPAKASNGPLLPDTSGEQWSFISQVEDDGKSRLTFTHTYEADGCTIAMRPPYTPDYHDAYIESLRDREGVTVHDIGESARGRPLHIVQVGGETPELLRDRPCILLYAREHPDEHDGSWVAQGAIEYMLLDTPDAARMRRQVTLLVMPLFDPDGAVDARYHRIVDTFGQDRNVPESDNVMRFFINWLNAGNRLDLVVNFHNVESGESGHIACGSFPARPDEMSDGMRYFHSLVHHSMESASFDSSKNTWGANKYYFRLTGFTQWRMKAPWILYEVNSQAPSEHLTLARLRIMGAVLTDATIRYVRSREFAPLMADARRHRLERMKRWLYWNPDFDPDRFSSQPFVQDRRIWSLGDPDDYSDSPAYPDYRERLKEQLANFN